MDGRGDPGLGSELASLLGQVGVEDKPARVVAHLSVHGEGRSSDIEQTCGLRQPEVSQATKLLRERGWIIARREKKPGKGRPVNKYELKVSLSDIIAEVEASNRDLMNRALGRIDRLKGIAQQLDGAQVAEPASTLS